MVVGMGAVFWICVGTVLLSQRCFSYCLAALTQSQGLSCFSHFTSRKSGGAQEFGEGTARTADPTDQRDIPYHRTSSPAYGAGRRRKGREFGVMLFVFPSTEQLCGAELMTGLNHNTRT